MTELSTSLVEPEAPELSTQLDAPRVSDETLDAKLPEEKLREPVKESRLEAIKRAAADNEPKPDAKPAATKEPVKDEAPADKAPGAEAEGEKEAAPAKEDRPRGKDHIEPPVKFLPRAKELWINTPREVKSELQRVLTEAEQETTQAREAAKEYEAVRPYAEMARQSGTTLDAALSGFVKMEQTLRSNPTEGFRGLLQNMNMNPVQAIGHMLAAFNVRPEQLAAHIAQNPQDYTARQQNQPAVPQTDAQVQALQQRLQAMETSIQERDIQRDIIEPFAAGNPRYHELSTVIASFLQSDMVPRSLSPNDRLAAAYDMAVRISPSINTRSVPEPQDDQGTVSSRAGDDFGGNKSVRGAPASGVETTNPRRGKLSRGESIKAAMSELGLAN